MIGSFRRPLFLGAHPDDEMGCAGTLARAAASGADVEVLTFSGCHDLIPEGYTSDDLANEWVSALCLLGIERRRMRMWDVPNRRFPEHRQDVLNVLDEHRDHGHDLILIPVPSDAHQDHATVAAEAIRAFKAATIFGYELPVNAVLGANLRAFVQLTDDDVERKVAHAATYRTQAGKPYMEPNFIRGLAAVRGMQIGQRAAEAFEVVRWIG